VVESQQVSNSRKRKAGVDLASGYSAVMKIVKAEKADGQAGGERAHGHDVLQ
jgi:hypothetical protein